MYNLNDVKRMVEDHVGVFYTTNFQGILVEYGIRPEVLVELLNKAYAKGKDDQYQKSF